MNEPLETIKTNCKRCGASCEFNGNLRFCPSCGTSLITTEKELKSLKKMTLGNLMKGYNYFYNSKGDLIKGKAIDIFTEYLENFYLTIERETIAIINSSLRSGYAMRLAEEEIIGGESRLNKKDFVEEAKNYIDRSKKNFNFLKTPSEDLILSVFFASENSNLSKLFLSGNVMLEYLGTLSFDNVNRLLPRLRDIFEEATLLHGPNGFPRYYEKPIHFSEGMQEEWARSIQNDTIFGYCVRSLEKLS